MIVYLLTVLLHIGLPEAPRRYTTPTHAPIHATAPRTHFTA